MQVGKPLESISWKIGLHKPSLLVWNSCSHLVGLEQTVFQVVLSSPLRGLLLPIIITPLLLLFCPLASSYSTPISCNLSHFLLSLLFFFFLLVWHNPLEIGYCNRTVILDTMVLDIEKVFPLTKPSQIPTPQSSGISKAGNGSPSPCTVKLYLCPHPPRPPSEWWDRQ